MKGRKPKLLVRKRNLTKSWMNCFNPLSARSIGCIHSSQAMSHWNLCHHEAPRTQDCHSFKTQLTTSRILITRLGLFFLHSKTGFSVKTVDWSLEKSPGWNGVSLRSCPNVWLCLFRGLSSYLVSRYHKAAQTSFIIQPRIPDPHSQEKGKDTDLKNGHLTLSFWVSGIVRKSGWK